MYTYLYINAILQFRDIRIMATKIKYVLIPLNSGERESHIKDCFSLALYIYLYLSRGFMGTFFTVFNTINVY